LKPGGRFFFNAYGNRHTSCTTGQRRDEGVTCEIQGGTLVGVGQVCFYGRSDVDLLFRTGWRLLSVQYLEMTETLLPEKTIHAEWRVMAEKEDAGVVV
jgi:hypothetical protein